MVLRVLSDDTRLHSNTRSTRLRDQQLNATSGQPQGEAYIPPSSRAYSGANIGQVPAGATRNRQQQRQQQQLVTSGECTRMLSLYHSTLIPSRDWWAIRTAYGITVTAGTSLGSNLGAYKPQLHQCGAVAAAWKTVTHSVRPNYDGK